MRLFVGIPLDEEARRGVEKVVKKLKRGHWPVKWEKPEKWHVTVAFLGELTETEIDKVIKAVEKGVRGIKPFEIRLKGLGSFPDLVLPRVVWLGLKGDLKNMARIYKGVREELRKLKLEFDEKPFRAHVTLGRVSKEARRKQRLELGKYLQKHREMKIWQQWRVEKVAVYESRLKPSGSEYKELKEVVLNYVHETV
jgi:2'-5' RNA ligase